MDEHELLTIEEVAQYLRVSERTVYDWASKGKIPCGKLGTTWRFKRSEVERWVDEHLGAGAKAATAPGDVALTDVLRPDRIVFLDTNRKESALTALVDCLASTPEVTDAEALSREIFLREALMSTGIGFNVAVPHVRLASVSDLVLAVGISRRPIDDYESLDDEPVRIVCMVAARPDQHGQYLKTLGAVSKALRPAQVREALLEAPDAKAAYLVLTA